MAASLLSHTEQNTFNREPGAGEDKDVQGEFTVQDLRGLPAAVCVAQEMEQVLGPG